MPPRTKVLVPIAVLVLVVLVGVLTAGAEPSASPHGAEDNFTLDYGTQQPGADDVSITVFAHDRELPTNGFETMDWIVVRSEETDFSNCGAANARAIGIDRGNNNSGTNTDEPLTTHVKHQSINENSFVVQFYKEDDIGGEPIFLNSTDQVVARLANCYQNPDEPGWYQWNGKINGTNYDGEYMTSTMESHYVYICDCENREEAVQTLGPPPSQNGNGDATPTPTEATGGNGDTPTSTEATGGNGDTPTPTEATGGNGDTPTSTEATGGNGDTPTSTEATGGNGDTPTGTDGGDGPQQNTDDVQQTPTEGDGPGFGIVVALLALVAAALVTVRRTR